jgi:hypothetical protein
VRLKYGQLHATAMCHYQSFALVVSQALGGDKKTSTLKSDYTDLAKAPSFDAALANINQALSYG